MQSPSANMGEEVFTNLASGAAEDVLLLVIVRVEVLLALGLDLELPFIESRVIAVSEDWGIGLLDMGPTA